MKTIQKIFIIISFVLAVLPGCVNNRTFETYHSFPNQAWDRFETIEIAVLIEDTAPLYDIFFIIDHDATYPFDTLYMHVVLGLPSGETRINEYSFDIKDEAGNFLAELQTDGTGSIKLPLRKGLKISKPGSCIFELEVLIPRVEIPGIHRIGIVMEITDPED